MKFKIYPAETIELELFQKGKKRVWVWVTWNRIDRTELDSVDYEWAENCENEEQLQKAFDEIMSTATPANKDSKDKHQKGFEHWGEGTYNIKEIERVTKIDEDSLINFSSGGGADAQVWSWENVTEKEKQQQVKDRDEKDEYVTLEQAAESWSDEILDYGFGYRSVASETYYSTPMKIKVDKEKLEKDNARAETRLKAKHRECIAKIDAVFIRKKPAKSKIESLRKTIILDVVELIIQYYEQKHGDTEFKGSGMKKIDNTVKINFLKSLK